MNVIQRLARMMSDTALSAEIRKRAAELDEWMSIKIDISNPDLARERLILRTFRDEWRNRTGEVL